MWTIVQFSLRRDGDYRAAFEVLASSGFQPHRTPAAGHGEPFPAAVVADLFQDPAVVTRAVFEAFLEAGLDPVGVAACHVDVGRSARPRRALASA